MPSLFQRYATPFITGLFLVSLVSGVALFFHVGQAMFHGMHEWLSMLLILPFVLHLWKNWRPMSLYFTKPAFAVAMVLSLAVAVPFALPSASGAGGPPILALSHRLLDNPVAEVAPLLKSTPEAVMEKLKASGFTAGAAGDTLAAIAKSSGKSDMELAAALNDLAP